MGAQQSQLPLEDQCKTNQKTLKKAIRELDRERTKLVQEEQKCIREMKKLAKENQVTPVKIMAKDLVRNRKHQSRFLEMKAQLQGVNLQLQTIKSQETMTRAMKGVTSIMGQMNQQMDAKSVQKIMAEFMTESERVGGGFGFRGESGYVGRVSTETGGFDLRTRNLKYFWEFCFLGKCGYAHVYRCVGPKSSACRPHVMWEFTEL